jgi:hypothetical protein
VLVEAHIVIAVRRTFAQQSGWKVIPKHALTDAEEPCILDWTDGLDAIAWDQMDRDDRDYENDLFRCSLFSNNFVNRIYE